MYATIFEQIIRFLKNASPVSIAVNLVCAAILLIVGVLLMTQGARTSGKRLAGLICLSISGLSVLSSLSTWFFSHFFVL